MLIGGIETLGLLRDRLALRGALWNAIAALAGNFTALGGVLIGLLATERVGFSRIRLQIAHSS